MSLQKIIEKTGELIKVPSVTGFEGSFLKYLTDDFRKKGYEVKNCGDNFLVVSRKGAKNPVLLTAHTDRHGLVLHMNSEFEYAAHYMKRFNGMKVTDSESLLKEIGERFVGEQVYVYNDFDLSGTIFGEGVVKSASFHLENKKVSFKIEGFKGLSPEFHLISSMASLPVAFKSELKQEGGTISSQIDNVISVALVYQLLEDGFDGEVLFSTQEEIGRSYLQIIDYLANERKATSFQQIVTIDTTPYADSRAITAGLVVLRNKDQHGIFNPDLVSRLRGACEEAGIRYEMKDEVIEAQNKTIAAGQKPKKLGSTELGRIIEDTQGRFNGSTVQLPSINYHTNHEATSELALGNCYSLLKAVL
jgi:putative aminopeptidase FrvX